MILFPFFRLSMTKVTLRLSKLTPRRSSGIGQNRYCHPSRKSLLTAAGDRIPSDRCGRSSGMVSQRSVPEPSPMSSPAHADCFHECLPQAGRGAVHGPHLRERPAPLAASKCRHYGGLVHSGELDRAHAVNFVRKIMLEDFSIELL